MQAAIEIGPFGYVMVASYAAFLNPRAVPQLPERIRSFMWRRRAGAGAVPDAAVATRSSPD
jgi:hypothetical protein